MAADGEGDSGIDGHSKVRNNQCEISLKISERTDLWTELPESEKMETADECAIVKMKEDAVAVFMRENMTDQSRTAISTRPTRMRMRMRHRSNFIGQRLIGC